MSISNNDLWRLFWRDKRERESTAGGPYAQLEKLEDEIKGINMRTN